MKFTNIKISACLGLLGGFFLLALLVLAHITWSAVLRTDEDAAHTLQQAASLSQAADTARTAEIGTRRGRSSRSVAKFPNVIKWTY
jgi:methyl-accepting chemotaxis protein-1 (serine sensor receptor)